ncbi:MAG: hypothetical protein J6W81_01365 [Lentisphaeria bacterium]|nr:hypothetical protein [Lentisphaeria bacterium]
MDSFQEMHTWQEIPLAGDENVAGKIRILADFPDPDALLETAYAFLKRLKSPEMVCRTSQRETDQYEEYYLTLAPGECTVSANDTEGIRRGIYKLAEILREKIPAEFPVQELKFTPHLRTRIGRYRFGKECNKGAIAELDEGAEAYPEPFLDRYASEGINAVWVKALKLNRISLTEWHPDDELEKRRRYASIQGIVDRCRRYGIRVFLYFVVPEGIYPGTSLWEQEDMKGPVIAGRADLCPAFSGWNYHYDSFRQILSALPGLGGFLLIVEGEGAAICSNVLRSGGKMCQERCHLSVGEVFVKEIEAIYQGMQSVDPSAELICWFYLPWDIEWKAFHEEILQKAPEGVIFQYNAESGSFPLQLGKPRFIGDYWQCISEPAPNYKIFAGYSKRYKRRCSAKIMVGASHEVGSIPYVPVPALLYRKYKKLIELGTTDVMQVWGTGGTPGMMNFTAGRLAFTDFSVTTEEDFLRSMANTLWANIPADEIIEAWRYFSDSYENYYPYSNMIQYYGPVADGINWPLYAYPVDKTLRATWTINQEISGDNVRECLSNHSLDELVTLFDLLSSGWEKGLEKFRKIVENHSLNEEQKREIVRMEALGIQFRNSYHIMRFYQLRSQIFNSEENLLEKIRSMRKIAEEEIILRKHLLELIVLDPVLGYNSEAEGYKYNAATIQNGLDHFPQTFAGLDRLEQGDFSTSAIKGFYVLDGSVVKMENFQWQAVVENDSILIHVDCDGKDSVLDEFFFAFDNKEKAFPVHAHFDSRGRVYIKPSGTEIRIHPAEDSWSIDIKIPIQDLPGKELAGLRMNLSRQIRNYEQLWSWPSGYKGGKPLNHLGLAFYNPQDMGELRVK